MMGDAGEVLRDKLAKLKNLIFQKQQRLQAIYNITKKQGQAIDQQDIEALNGCIKEKQKHIDAIDILDGEFADIYDGNVRECLKKGKFHCGDKEGLTMFEDLQAEIYRMEDIINKIYDLDKTNKDKGQDLMKNLREKIRHIQKGKKGHDAYNKAYGENDGIFIDSKK